MREGYEKRLGTVVGGKWTLVRLLGWGSTSAVYEGRDGAESCAIKILHKGLCAEKEVVQRFRREAYVTNGIRHRSILPVRGDGVIDGTAYIVIDLLEGETLEERRVRHGGKLDLAPLIPLIEELMSALTAVHAANVVHRDLKPQNVFLTTSGELKLLDFGTARIFDAPPESGRNPISVEGLVIGTPSFMSPEQARGEREEIDAAADIWSLGATIFTALSGEYVHLGRDAHQRLLAAATRPARSLSEVMPSIDSRIAAVVDRALALSKGDRWPDVRSMRMAFRRACIDAGLRDEPSPSSSDAVSPPASY